MSVIRESIIRRTRKNKRPLTINVERSSYLTPRPNRRGKLINSPGSLEAIACHTQTVRDRRREVEYDRERSKRLGTTIELKLAEKSVSSKRRRVLMNAERLIGTVVGTCTLQKLIGQGGMGAVYLAYQSRPKRLVAVKVLLPMASLHPDHRSVLLERFRREATP